MQNSQQPTPINNPATPQEEFQPKPKNSKLLYVALGLVAICFIGLAGFLAGQYLTKKQIANQPPVASQNPTPTPTPQAQVDETADWETYTSEGYGFEFKYPKLASLKETNYTGYLASTTIFLDNITPYATIDISVQASWDGTGEAKTAERNIVIDGLPAYKKSYPGGQNPPGELVYFEKDGNVFRIFLSWDGETQELKNVFDQILSTFKFLDEGDQSLDLDSYRELLGNDFYLVKQNYREEALFVHDDNKLLGPVFLEGELWTIKDEDIIGNSYDYYISLVKKFINADWEKRFKKGENEIEAMMASGPMGSIDGVITFNNNQIKVVTISQYEKPSKDSGLKFYVFVSNNYSFEDILQLAKTN
ncbi:hypothetical protein GYA49_00625 [Candidatus Beckwithbacteria bacterium]|nr:hypothetical protein [Candidatus Beckwithbacteria bacterium]